jgi:hypothetical protein
VTAPNVDLGDVVIYHLSPRDHGAFPHNGALHCAATVVKVHEDTGKVNLRLLGDGPGLLWWVSFVDQGEGPGQWTPRIHA